MLLILQMQSKRKELIDTLWNVNVSTDDAELSIDMELIDTLWNVNCLQHQ